MSRSQTVVVLLLLLLVFSVCKSSPALKAEVHDSTVNNTSNSQDCIDEHSFQNAMSGLEVAEKRNQGDLADIKERIRKLESRYKEPQQKVLEKVQKLEDQNNGQLEIARDILNRVVNLEDMQKAEHVAVVGEVTNITSRNEKMLRDVLTLIERREIQNKDILLELTKKVQYLETLVVEQKEKIEILRNETKQNNIAKMNVSEMYNRLETLKNKVDMLEQNTSESKTEFPKDCWDVKSRNDGISGIYTLKPRESKPFSAFCDNGWTYIQHRFDGSVDFYRTWSEFASGFGNLSGEHWLGLNHVFYLTHQDTYTLRIEVEGWKDERYWAQYSQFSVSDESTKFTLHITGYTGNHKNHMSGKNLLKFTTKDSDNDNYSSDNCASLYYGAGWLKRCGSSLFRTRNSNNSSGQKRCMNFYSTCVKKSLMKIIPTSAI